LETDKQQQREKTRGKSAVARDRISTGFSLRGVHVLDTAQNSVLIAIWVALSMAYLVLLNHFWPSERRRIHNDVIGWQISILGTIYAVMIGFMLYAVWANFQTADTNASNEANSLVNLFRTADGLPPAQRDGLKIAAVNYANVVIANEWPTMSRDGVAHAGHAFVDRMWRIAVQTQTSTYTQQASLAQTMNELSDMTKHRRIRILESKTKMPPILWIVLVIGGVITIGSSCLIGTENFPLQFCLIFALSLLISMALVAIGDIDRPFQGSVHVSPYAFVRAQQTMLNPGSTPRE
jgi:hypothetical protein